MSELTKKKTYRSLINIPIKVEMQPVEHQSNRVLTVEDLSSQIDEARKGKAKVDSKYVGYEDAGHLHDYKYDYVKFLDNMSHIIKTAKQRKRDQADQVYKNPHRMIIQ